MYRPLVLLSLAFLPLCLAPALRAQAPVQDQNQASPRELRVLVKPTPAFVMKDSAGAWSGISIELWRRISALNGWKSSFEEVPDIPTLLTRMAGEDTPDVAVAAVTLTAEREAKHDFSHGFYNAGLGIAISGSEKRPLAQVMQRVLSTRFLGTLFYLCLMLFGIGALLWLFERRSNREQFGETTSKGLGNGFWWAAVTMTTVGYGDKSPVTFAGRLVGLIWMFASIILISTFTGAIASTLTLSQLEGRVKGPDDLAGARVAVVAGTTGATWCESRGIVARELPTVDEALDVLRNDVVDAVLYDAPLMRYTIRQKHAGYLSVLPYRIQPSSYAFVLPEGSELKEQIDRSMLQVLATTDWPDVLQRYLGSDG